MRTFVSYFDVGAWSTAGEFFYSPTSRRKFLSPLRSLNWFSFWWRISSIWNRTLCNHYTILDVGCYSLSNNHELSDSIFPRHKECDITGVVNFFFTWELYRIHNLLLCMLSSQATSLPVNWISNCCNVYQTSGCSVLLPYTNGVST